MTGTTLIFLKGNTYLINSIRSSLILAIFLISLVMALLFRSLRMILISIFTNLLPLVVTAGLMGYFGVPIKPSTALIFSIAFGIAVDDSIHFLARYRQALLAGNYRVSEAINVGLWETGPGMFYTSIILFFGFIVFTYSQFEGTIALGALTSITLLCAMFSNLILLPALLLSFDTGRYSKKNVGLIEYYDEGFIEGVAYEADDEEIDLSQIRVKKNQSNVEKP
ncbi:MAG: MMPL family transporter [Bacteroidia bacterium]|nr:MMPL family transporter [Bacteroidia bacterium]